MVKMILWTALTLCTIFTSYGHTVTNRILLCLAKEEEFIHKNKIRHSLYPMNQFFMNYFASRQGLKLKDIHYKKVCTKPPSSFALMSLLLTHGKNSFLFDNNIQVLSQGDDVEVSAFRLFFEHISRLEAGAPRANCLRDNIIHLKEITMRYSHLENLGHQKITQTDSNKLKVILNALEDVGLIYRKCSLKQ